MTLCLTTALQTKNLQGYDRNDATRLPAPTQGNERLFIDAYVFACITLGNLQGLRINTEYAMNSYQVNKSDFSNSGFWLLLITCIVCGLPWLSMLVIVIFKL